MSRSSPKRLGGVTDRISVVTPPGHCFPRCTLRIGAFPLLVPCPIDEPGDFETAVVLMQTQRKHVLL
jgi:hypothetical protein